MFAFLRIERPTMQTLRSELDGDVDGLLHAVDVRRERRRRGSGLARSGKICRKASPTIRSDGVKPGRSAFVESPSMRSTPWLPSVGEACRRPS